MLRTMQRVFFLTIVCLLTTFGVAAGQQSTKALSNEDIIKMMKSGLAESTILAVIQASPTNFDISPSALITMKTSGLSQNVIGAVVAAATNRSASSATRGSGTATSGTPSREPVPKSKPISALVPGSTANTLTTPPQSVAATSATKEPFVVMLPAAADSDESINLTLEKTRLSQTKTKASSLGGLANDSMTVQALQTGINMVAWQGAVHSGSLAGGIAAAEMGGIFGSALSHRKTTVTYLWAVQGASSATQANSDRPRFSVNFAGWMYVTLDDFEPVIVKLTPTPPPSVWRLVGASQGKEDAYSNSSVDWQVFSNFMQDPAPSWVKKISPGVYEISASQPLESGDYGIVLRPISKNMKFSGADVARNQGNGKVFNSVWTFHVR